MHGNIVGKVIQTTSEAVVIASQVNPVDSVVINPSTEGIFYWGQYSTAPNPIYYADAQKGGGFDPGATITTYSKITSFSYKVSQKDSYTDHFSPQYGTNIY